MGLLPTSGETQRSGPTGRDYATVALAYLLAWFVLDWAASFFEIAPKVSVWYPPVGLSLALLLIGGLRFAPVLFVHVAIRPFLVQGSAVDLWSLVLSDVATALAYTGAAWVLLRRLHIDARLPRQRDLIWFVAIGCVLAPAVEALVQTALVNTPGTQGGEPLWVTYLGLFSGDATGAGIAATTLIVALRPFPALWPGYRHGVSSLSLPDSGWAWAKLAGRVIVVAVALWMAYGDVPAEELDYAYVVYVPLIWVAVSNGFAAMVLLIVVLNVGAVTLADVVGGQGDINLQLGLLALTLIGLLLAAETSERSLISTELRFRSLHDTLTGLPNRVVLLDRIDHARQRLARHPQELFAVLYIDLDRFKSVNDSFGHPVGDHLLGDVADRLRGSMRSADTLARVGGDEFVAVLEDVDSTESAYALATRLLESLQAPFNVHGRSIRVGASGGLAMPQAHWTADELLRNADTALHKAKESGDKRAVVFQDQMHDEAVRDLKLAVELRAGLERSEPTVYYQPMFSAQTRLVEGFEALARWSLQDGEAIPPPIFIALAEDTGLIHQLGATVMEQAVQMVADLRTHQSEMTMAVNVSPLELHRTNFADDVLAILDRHRVPADALEIEITESALLHDQETVRTHISRLSVEGVRFILDDFGSGYSSFDYLRQFAVAGLKFDKDFSSRLPAEAATAAIAEGVLAMADRLGIAVTAEGIETEEQRAYFTAQGCDRLQGYLLGRPLPAADALTLAGSF